MLKQSNHSISRIRYKIVATVKCNSKRIITNKMEKPNLEYIMEECIQAGIKQFIFVTLKNRPIIKKYFF